MKKILGLDLGTASIGSAIVKEDYESQNSSIVHLGVRVIPLSSDEKKEFHDGSPITTNALRREKRGARRNLQRYKLRREYLKEILVSNQLIKKDDVLFEKGENSTHELIHLRAKAVTEKVSLLEFARILFAINKKRGYKSNRKIEESDSGVVIDGMKIARILAEDNLTPGEYVYKILNKGSLHLPSFYRSDLINEFDKVWNFQKKFHKDFLDDELRTAIVDQGLSNTRKRILAIKGIYTAENKGKRDVVRLQKYKWRSEALSKELSKEEVAYVLCEINNDLNKSSGYLGAISDRSKTLYFEEITVGQYLSNKLKNNPHDSIKNLVFYRQDYQDEFETIWNKQSTFHSVLKEDLKKEIRDVIIFYQRSLKSQKNLISFCPFESKDIKVQDKKTGKISVYKTGSRVVPKSSPIFQYFRIWQGIRNLEINGKLLCDEHTRQLFDELNVLGDLTEKQIIKLLGFKSNSTKTNFKKGLIGNRTNANLLNGFKAILEMEGYGIDWDKKSGADIKTELTAYLNELNIDVSIFEFDINEPIEKQSSYNFWHTLYATIESNKYTEEDITKFGNNDVSLKKALVNKFGFKVEHASILCNTILETEYGSLSFKSIKKILPFMIDGNDYSEACKLAGYNHSFSETKEALENKVYKDRLELIRKNSLRNPIVEKILNQMVNVVNTLLDKYGKFDEIRIELSRELKKNAKERKELTEAVNKGKKRHDEITRVLQEDFKIPNPTRNDIIRYKLWEELSARGYKSIFTDEYIPKEKLFSNEIDIEHIIPKAKLFDDSFSNKTLAYKKINLQKRDRTAYDFISEDYDSELENYIGRVEAIYDNGKGSISKSKKNKLLMKADDIGEGFIERDLRNSQYIAKKARQMLLELVPTVVSTTGNITSTLRKDWDLINVMKELNYEKYKKADLIDIQERLNIGLGKIEKKEVLRDWTKRNDQRHHAMDALTVAFTTHNHIQYLNNLNARKNESHEKHKTIFAIENTITEKKKDKQGNEKRLFKPPMKNFRTVAKKHLESILVSYKAKNKVMTKNTNKYKCKDGFKRQETLTPRGQLHEETIYGKVKRQESNARKINKKLTRSIVDLVVDPDKKEVLINQLELYNDPVKAFSTKLLKKDPILFKGDPLEEVICFEEVYSIRKAINSELNLEKVSDMAVKRVLLSRLEEYDNNKMEAFSDLEKNPIWLNKEEKKEEKKIAIKKVTLFNYMHPVSLHSKRENSNEGKDYVQTGSNHHIAIYEDVNGDFHEKVVTFFEAVNRVNLGLPIVDKTYNQEAGWRFKFTLKQNEMFIFPSNEINLEELSLNTNIPYHTISKSLFRVQSISSKDYRFSHHLETKVMTKEDLKNKKGLKDKIYRRIQSLNGLKGIRKIRINHIGEIVGLDEY